MAASSVFQRPSWKFDQLTPTTGPLPWAKAAPAERARAARLINACFFESISFLLGGALSQDAVLMAECRIRADRRTWAQPAMRYCSSAEIRSEEHTSELQSRQYL